MNPRLACLLCPLLLRLLLQQRLVVLVVQQLALADDLRGGRGGKEGLSINSLNGSWLYITHHLRIKHFKQIEAHYHYTLCLHSYYVRTLTSVLAPGSLLFSSLFFPGLPFPRRTSLGTRSAVRARPPGTPPRSASRAGSCCPGPRST